MDKVFESRLDRRLYIGGSGAATVLGYADYDTALQYWRNKGPNGRKIDFNNHHMARGNTIEPIIQQYIREHIDPTAGNVDNFVECDAYIHEWRQPRSTARRLIREGQQIFVWNTEILSPSGKPFLGGHPDDIGDEVVWEYKAPTMYNFDRILREGLPKSWLLQVQHYMFLTGRKKGCVALWDYNNWRVKLFWVDADPEMEDLMRRCYTWFWGTVEEGIEPTEEDFGKNTYKEQFAWIDDDRLDKLFEDYKEATSRRYDGERDQKLLKAEIVTYAQGRSILQTDKYTCKLSRGYAGKNRTPFWKATVSAVDESKENEPTE